MKLSALLLPLIALTLVQEALSTHLETCECHQIQEIINTTVQEAVAGLEDRLTLLFDSALNTTDNAALEKLQNSLTTTMEQLLKPMKQQLDYHLPPPPQTTAPPQLENSEDNPASSCKELHEDHPDASSGYYWISKTSGSPVRVYCSMSMTCGSETGGWMKIADIDMRNTSHTCPSGLSTLSSPKRLCEMTVYNRCVSKTFSVQEGQYSRVCGKIIGYEKNVPLAFYYGSRGIDGAYAFGVSLTHGQNPRQHIWTFAGASDETSSQPSYKCPCINTALSSSSVPSFVGNDYFCDTAFSSHYGTYSRNPLETTDPLWDGEGCGPTNTCCTFNSPPWFVKDLPSPTTDSVEMRMCRPDSNNSPLIESIELYVQ